MKEVITIGVDLAKNVFQVHGVDPERPFRPIRWKLYLPMSMPIVVTTPALCGMLALAARQYQIPRLPPARL